MKKIKINYKTICGVVSFIGFFYMLGAVGGMEIETMTIKQGMLHSIIGIALFAGGAYMGGFMG